MDLITTHNPHYKIPNATHNSVIASFLLHPAIISIQIYCVIDGASLEGHTNKRGDLNSDFNILMILGTFYGIQKKILW
jgi:hypothetical protein